MTESNAFAHTFTIHPAQREVAEAAVARVAKKAAKLGAAAPTITFGEVYYTIDERTQRRVARLRATVSGEPPRLPGDHRLAAVVEPLTEGNNAVLRVPGHEGALPERLWSVGMDTCEHCNTRRKRNQTFLVVDVDGRETLVGRSCLADFIGGESAADAVFCATYAAELAGTLEELERGFGGHRAPDTEDLVDVLAVAAAHTRVDGFVPKSRGDGRDTAGAVSYQLAGPPRDTKAARQWLAFVSEREPTAEDEATAEATMHWALSHKGQVKLSDYMRNAIALVEAGYTVPRTFGIAVSLVASYERAMRIERERASQAAEDVRSEHVGTVGKREVFTGLTVTRHMVFAGHYGDTHMYLFRSQEGNVLKWMASKSLLVDEGDTIDLKATVKAHDEYNGTAQTVVNRGVLV